MAYVLHDMACVICVWYIVCSVCSVYALGMCVLCGAYVYYCAVYCTRCALHSVCVQARAQARVPFPLPLTGSDVLGRAVAAATPRPRPERCAGHPSRPETQSPSLLPRVKSHYQHIDSEPEGPRTGQIWNEDNR